MNKISLFNKIIERNNLGRILEEPIRITGGLSHRMYKVITDKGTYAVKELNSGVMKKDNTYSNFFFAEGFTDLAIANGIPAIGAIKINNDIMQKIDDQYYMIFEWVEGRVLQSEDIEDKHAEIIGKLLADIHNIDFSSIDDDKRKHMDTIIFEWINYVSLAKKQNKSYFQLYKDNIDMLYDLNKKSKKALEYANKELIISHRDLDRKNILWQGYKPFIIDWEASGYINPTLELIQVAWYWSGGDIEKIDYSKFEKVIKNYKDNYNGNIDKNIYILIYADFYSGLEWLDYNLRRSLSLDHEYDEEEIQLADDEVIQSINEIKYNISQISKIIYIFKK